jgi:hypothetical protein
MSVFNNIVSIVIPVLSLAFGIYQWCQNRRINHLRIIDALIIHKLSAQALGAIQGNNVCNKMLEILSGDRITKKIIYDIGLSEGYCQSLFIETAKIFCNLKNITIHEINNMIENGQLSKEYENYYKSFAKIKTNVFFNKINKTINKGVTKNNNEKN